MKKICILLAFMLASTFNLLAADQITAKLSGTSLKIALQNETTFCAFQMDITLPEGISAQAVAAVAARLGQDGADETIGSPKFIVAYNTIAGNKLRVLAYNLANAQIKDAVGDILDITLSAEVADATSISVSNIIFVDAESLAEVALSNVTADKAGVLGDITRDGAVNVFDISALATIILGGDTTGFDLSVADVNGDGNTNVFDISALASIILK